MTTRSIAEKGVARSCYFRTTVEQPFRKALVQINEDCNLHCAHCFVSASRIGRQMPLAEVVEKVIPRLVECRVRRVTLTGGEPSIHPDFLAIVREFHAANLHVGICTNATTLDDTQIRELAELGVHCNVSLDGFAETSHGKFRGDRASFAVTVATVEKLGRAGVLQGLLCTPNTLAFQVGNNTACGACSLDSGCGKGCPAAVVAAGGRIGDVDAEQCPVTTVMPAGGRRLLPLMPT